MKVVAIASAIILALGACSTALSAPESSHRQYSEAVLAKYEQSLLNALGQASNPKGTDVLLRRKLAADEFEALPPERQYHWLQMSASLALGLDDLEYAHATSLRMIAMEEATAEDWRLRFSCTRRSFDPNRFWWQLARAHLEQGQIERARQAAVRVTAPRLILTMRVDQRFQPFLVAQPDHFDVLAAVDKEIAALEQLSKACPRLITPKVMWAQALNVARRYDLAIKVTDEVLADSGMDRVPSALYDDAPSAFPWILNVRASALQGVAKFDEAAKYLRAAVSLETRNQRNVGPTINLAFMYASLRRADEARAQLRDLLSHDESMLRYAQMQVQRVLVLAAIADNDERALRAALDDLRNKQNDSPSTFQKALLDANQLDEAAALLIRRLRSASMRGDALFDVQDFRDGLSTPAAQARQRRWAELRARQDVQAAIAEVGHVEVVPLDFE
jgi:tetratricopeptide (TPR) repeat protein